MTLHIFPTVLLLTFLNVGLPAKECPLSCVCYASITDCRNVRLTTVPKDIVQQTETLFLSHNQLTVISSIAFWNLTSLTFLDISKNNIIPENDTLDYVCNLLSLDFSENDIQSIPTDIFQPTPKLVWLNLARNQLKGLPNDIIRNLRNLTYLDLSFNSIELQNNTFDSLYSLNTLILSGNRLSSLPTMVFYTISQLQILDLSNNNLTYLSSKLFAKTDSLTDLILSNNKLTGSVLPALRGLSNLKYLYLSNNSISTLPPLPFESFPLLHKVTLSNNSLSVLPDDLLKGLHQLAVLDLSGNSIAQLPKEVFPNNSSLQYLHMDRNMFSEMPMLAGLQNVLELTLCCSRIQHWPSEVTVSHLESLETLDLSRNLIVNLELNKLRYNTKLKNVLLTNNPICVNMIYVVMPLKCIN
ncbi:insulin-like growth factor-binding protein complex acid labile subunit [Anguilla rostrata]|uniref:insulin-like growth factor-binding protein complex acid labile subunit n=1 Tax=Anguilla rostrata TaxID=7938 RepID=UPI0030CD9963